MIAKVAEKVGPDIAGTKYADCRDKAAGESSRKEQQAQQPRDETPNAKRDPWYTLFYFIKYSYFLSGAMRCCEIAIFVLTGSFLATNYSLPTVLAFFIGSLAASITLSVIVHLISEQEDNNIDRREVQICEFHGTTYNEEKRRANQSLDAKTLAIKEKLWKSCKKFDIISVFKCLLQMFFVPHRFYLFIDFMCVFGAIWNIVDEINRWFYLSNLPSNMGWLVHNLHYFLLAASFIPLICLVLKFKYTRQMFVMRQIYRNLDSKMKDRIGLESAKETNTQKETLSDSKSEHISLLIKTTLFDKHPQIKEYFNKLEDNIDKTAVINLLVSHLPLYNPKHIDKASLLTSKQNPTSEKISKKEQAKKDEKLQKKIKTATIGFISILSLVLFWIWVPHFIPTAPLDLLIPFSLLAVALTIYAAYSFINFCLNLNEKYEKSNDDTLQALREKVGGNYLDEEDNIQKCDKDHFLKTFKNIFPKNPDPSPKQILYMKMAITIFRYEHKNYRPGKKFVRLTQNLIQRFMTNAVIPGWNLCAIAFPIVFNINILAKYAFGMPSIFVSWPALIIEGIIAVGLALYFSTLRIKEHHLDNEEMQIGWASYLDLSYLAKEFNKSNENNDDPNNILECFQQTKTPQATTATLSAEFNNIPTSHTVDPTIKKLRTKVQKKSNHLPPQLTTLL